ncbi:MAG TPA: hypothetical protein VMZ31_02180 [Phycisphaerae bacterium]|nr:hypothetical protein [Phycisphaerae bacterium]
MSRTTWKDHKYDEVFESTCAYVAMRRQTDPSFSIETLEGLLETQCTYQGQGWDGMGEMGLIVTSATIAAYEHMLVEWRKELSDNPSVRRNVRT